MNIKVETKEFKQGSTYREGGRLEGGGKEVKVKQVGRREEGRKGERTGY